MSNATICPTITADNTHTYKIQMDDVTSFARRIHIDLADGVFTPNKLVGVDEIWWPATMRADIHIMYQNPFALTEAIVALKPQLVIVHAEAQGEFIPFSNLLHAHGIEVGVALLAKTSAQTIIPALGYIDHVLIFSGNIGHFGGHADLGLLDKVKQIKSAKPTIEIGWDGGIGPQNAHQLAENGVEVLNAGGFLHGAQDPGAAYATLKGLIEK